jgi:hypothetical protein
MNYPKFLIANTYHGVYQVSVFAFCLKYQHLAPLKPKYFLENLSTLDDNETLSTIIDGDDAEIFDTINSQYGIN